MNQKYKPLAKCEYSGRCCLYNSNALQSEVELKMCGLGQKLDPSYRPKIPMPKTFAPTEDYPFDDTGGTCEAYFFYKDEGMITRLKKHLSSIQNELINRW